MAQLYTLWQALYMSFYSRALYLDVGRGWRGTGFKYIGLISVLCAAVLVGSWTYIISRVDLTVQPSEIPGKEEKKDDLNSILVQLVAQVPVITISKGEVSITQEEPYTIYYPENNKPFAIIDTKGTFTSLDNTEAMVLLTKDKLIYKTAADKVESYNVATLSQGDRMVDAYTVTGWIQQGKKILLFVMPLVIFPVLAMFGFVYLTVRGLIFGFLGVVIGNALKVEELEYVDYVRLAAIASTPVAFIYLLILLFPPLGALRFLNAFIFAVGVGYMYFAARANR